MSYFEKTSSNDYLVGFFLATSVLLILFDIRSCKTKWSSFCFLMLHILLLVAFGLLSMVMLFVMRGIQKGRITDYEDQILANLFWSFVVISMTRILIFCFQFWSTLRRTMAYRNHVFE